MATPTIKAGVVQMSSGTDKVRNVQVAERLIREAAAQEATLIVLPEMFNCLGRFEEIVEQAEPLDGPTFKWLAALANELEVTLVGGSFAERIPNEDKVYNTCLTLDPTGRLIAKYRKIHLFDVELPDGPSVHESDYYLPGDALTVVNSGNLTLGHAICYDLRFPELFRKLTDQQAECVCLPSAFTARTGQAHWEVLVRARAIENQTFLLAANQIGQHTTNMRTYGHSMIIDPWGEVLVDLGDATESVGVAELSLDRLRSVRQGLPALQHRKL